MRVPLIKISMETSWRRSTLTEKFSTARVLQAQSLRNRFNSSIASHLNIDCSILLTFILHTKKNKGRRNKELKIFKIPFEKLFVTISINKNLHLASFISFAIHLQRLPLKCKIKSPNERSSLKYKCSRIF